MEDRGIPDPAAPHVEAVEQQRAASRQNGFLYFLLAVALAALVGALFYAVDKGNQAEDSGQDARDAYSALRAQFVYCTDPENVDKPACGQPVAPAPGEPGQAGPPGAQGEAGQPGDTGASCVAQYGLAVCSGPAGKRGPRGFTGLDGPPGPAGAVGKPGQNGQDGGSGEPGASCVQQLGVEACRGPQGEPGPAGGEGPRGPAGQDGHDGAAGLPGTALPGTYGCPSGQYVVSLTVDADGSVTVACDAPLLP